MTTYFRTSPKSQKVYEPEAYKRGQLAVKEHNLELKGSNLEKRAEQLVKDTRSQVELAKEIGSFDFFRAALENLVVEVGEYMLELKNAGTGDHLDTAYRTIGPLVEQYGKLGFELFREALAHGDRESAEAIACRWAPIIESYVGTRLVRGVPESFEHAIEVFNRLKQVAYYDTEKAFPQVELI